MYLIRGLLLASFATAAMAQGLQLEEITVSAQHRKQQADQVPISMSFFSARQLQHWQVQNVDDLTAITPALSGWQQGLSTPIYALRGISSNSFGIGGEASVAVFVDDGYIGRINSTAVRMLDIERIEVLKGPQGTLLGRNASAGAIHYHTRLPSPDPEISYRLEAGDFQHREVSVTANGAVFNDQLWLRVNGFYLEQQGDATNQLRNHDVGGEDGHGLRLAFRHQRDDWDINLSLSNQQLDSGGLGYESINPMLAAIGGVSADPFDDELATDIKTYDRIESSDANLRIDWQTAENWQLRSITSWHDNNSPNLFDVDGSALFLTSAGFTRRDSETFSQEFRFSGQHGDLDWVAGINYFGEQISTRIELGYSDINRLTGVPMSLPGVGNFFLCDATSNFLFGPCQASVTEIAQHRGDYQSTGAFADLSWSVSEQLTISAGLRYSYDDKNFDYRSAPVSSVTTTLNALRTAPLNPSGNLLGYSSNNWQTVDHSWDDWQPRLAINYHLTEQHTLYANLARGYKAGGFEPAATPALSVYQPETVTSTDIGLRGQLLQQRLQYNIAAYHYDYRDYQVQIISNGIARTINSEGVTGSGLEWEINSQLNRYWQLRLHGAYSDARFDRLLTDNGNFKGNHTILTPRHSAGLLLDYQGSEADWGSFGLSWQSVYQSDIFYTVQNTEEASRGDLPLHHLQLNYYAPGKKWQLSLIARNLFDRDYTIFQQDVGAGPVSRRGMPRHLGIAISGKL